MVLLEAFAIASGELFAYNRENFQFDNEQRISRDVQKYKMQVERFELFREDIEDLVDLTVSKMDMYHLVAAVVLGFTTSIFTEGRINAECPPSYVAIYFMTIGCGWMYLLLVVWLSMYASVASHSLGVRLRTRYIRLPIPSSEQLSKITSKLKDFEQQGAGKVLRVPFGLQGTPEWKAPNAGSEKPNLTRTSSRSSAQSEDLLAQGEAAFGREDVLTTAASTAPGQHIQLFRKLQAKWQCFDAYSRVSMCLGVHQIVQAVNLFVLGMALVENNTPSTAVAITLMMQTVAASLFYMDMVGLNVWEFGVCALVASGPSVVTLVSLILAVKNPQEGKMTDYEQPLPGMPVAFICQAVHFSIVLFLATPSKDGASLPRRFRAVLFMDVFGDANYDPTDAEHIAPPRDDSSFSSSSQGEVYSVAFCESTAATAQMALRRWEALPEEHLLDKDGQTLWQLRKQHTIWRKALTNHIAGQNTKRGVPDNSHVQDAIEQRPWAELSRVEKEEDEFADFLIGPIEQRRQCYYDLEEGKLIWDKPGHRSVLALKDVQILVQRLERAVKSLHTAAQEQKAQVKTQSAGSGSSARTVAAPGERSMKRSWTTYFTKTSTPQVDNLPWKVLMRLTKVLQICWLFLAVVEAMANWAPLTFGPDVFRIHVEPAAGIESEHAVEGEVEKEAEGERRLAMWWQGFKEEHGSWPHGIFFQAVALSCLTSNDFTRPAELLVTSPFALHSSHDQLSWKTWPRANFAQKAVAACGLSSSDRQPEANHSACVMLAPLRSAGLALWRPGSRFSEALELAFEPERNPWLLAAGGVMPCSRTSSFMSSSVLSTAGQCLILAGWDGQRLSVAVLPLSDSRGGLSDKGQNISFCFDLPLPPSKVVALHVEAKSGRLWVLLNKGELLLWDLPRGRSQGSWLLDWGNFSPAGLCVASSHKDRWMQSLLVVGTAAPDDNSSIGRPAMMKADLPADMASDFTAQI